MAKPDGRIEKGQRLASAISARAWNRAQDAADIVLGVRPGVTAGETTKANHATIVNAFCISPQPLNQYEIVQITQFVPGFGLPDESTLRSYQFVPRFRLPATANAEWARHLAVLQEPAKANQFSRIAVAGPTPARVTFPPGLFFPSLAFCGLRTYNFVTNSSFGGIGNLEKGFAFQAAATGPVRILDYIASPGQYLTLENDIERNDSAAELTAWMWVML